MANVRRGVQMVRRPAVSIQRRQLGGPPFARQSSSFLYSSNKLPTAFAAASYDFFTVGVGNTGQGYGSTALTYTETNLQTGRRIPDQSKWQCRSIGFSIAAGSATGTATAQADIIMILENTYLQITKPDYFFVYGPPVLYPAGAGLAGTGNACLTNGTPQAIARVKLNTPIILDPGETFSFQLVCTATQTLGATVVVKLVLFGDTANEIVQ